MGGFGGSIESLKDGANWNHCELSLGLASLGVVARGQTGGTFVEIGIRASKCMAGVDAHVMEERHHTRNPFDVPLDLVE